MTPTHGNHFLRVGVFIFFTADPNGFNGMLGTSVSSSMAPPRKLKVQSITVLLLSLLIADRMSSAQDLENVPGSLDISFSPRISPPPSSSQAGAGTASTSDDWVWSSVPPLQLPRPRAGFFTIAPKGPGYYSLSDALTETWRSEPPKVPYPSTSSNPYPFFEADYRYLDALPMSDRDLLDRLKRFHPNEDWMLSLGGEERLRFMNALDDARLTGVQSSFLLDRTRLYGDLWYRDLFRIYMEGIDAHTTPQGQAPLAIDVDTMDIWNLFVESKVATVDDAPVYVRYGRQELNLGSQRLISPSDWSNIPRTFQGVRATYNVSRFSLDAFWVNPVLINANQLDSPVHNENFSGIWSTFRPVQGQSIDAYYLYLGQSQPVAKGTSNIVGGFNVNTIGSRYSGDRDNFLWDFEAMYQFGNWSNQSTSAQAATGGLGYRFADVPMAPNIWALLDYASGDPHLGSGGTHRTFNQLFPWGHTYFGYLDLVGRQNIVDPNLQLTVTPSPWLLVGLQGHFFYLASARDALYNSSGTALFVDPTGRSGNHVGNEIDFYTNIHLSKRQDVLIGYSHLFVGQFLQAAGTTAAPNLIYVQYSVKW